MNEGRTWFRRAGSSRGAAVGEPIPAPGDGWSSAVAIDWRDAGQAALLRAVVESAGPGSRPAQRPGWLPAVQTLGRRENREAHAALLALFEALAEAVPHAESGPASDGRPLLVGARNTVMAVNTLWAAAELLGPGSVPKLERVLQRALAEPWTLDSSRVRDVCVLALAEIGTEEALEALVGASRRAPTKSLREQILLVISRTGRGERMLPSRQAELHIADHGLSGAGRREITVRRHVFELVLDPEGRVRVLARDEDATPDAAAERVAAAEARSLRAAYGRELTRIEALLATGRSWPYETWRLVYLGHPITRTVAARLVWRMEHPGGRIVDVLPRYDGGVSAARPAADLEDAVPGAGGLPGDGGSGSAQGSVPETVRLWHPRDAAPAQLAAWRKIRDELRLVQPFEQIDRDFTRVDPEPDEAELNQFTGVRIDARAFAASLAGLGWHARQSEAAEKADAVHLAHRDFPDDGLSIAVPYRENADRAGAGVVLGAGWFHRSEDHARTPLALGYVPPLVHSEALRDIAVLARAAHGTDDGGVRDGVAVG